MAFFAFKTAFNPDQTFDTAGCPRPTQKARAILVRHKKYEIEAIQNDVQKEVGVNSLVFRDCYPDHTCSSCCDNSSMLDMLSWYPMGAEEASKADLAPRPAVAQGRRLMSDSGLLSYASEEAHSGDGPHPE
jgi:hypothetical protein